MSSKSQGGVAYMPLGEAETYDDIKQRVEHILADIDYQKRPYYKVPIASMNQLYPVLDVIEKLMKTKKVFYDVCTVTESSTIFTLGLALPMYVQVERLNEDETRHTIEKWIGKQTFTSRVEFRNPTPLINHYSEECSAKAWASNLRKVLGENYEKITVAKEKHLFNSCYRVYVDPKK
jgi:hypothetical protein